MCVSVWRCPSFVYSLYVNWWLDINVQGTDETSETSRKEKSGCKSTKHVVLYEHHVFNGDLKLWTYQEGVHWGHRCQGLMSFSCSLFIFYFQSIYPLLAIRDNAYSWLFRHRNQLFYCLSLCLWFECLINMPARDFLLLWVLGWVELKHGCFPRCFIWDAFFFWDFKQWKKSCFSTVHLTERYSFKHFI